MLAPGLDLTTSLRGDFEGKGSKNFGEPQNREGCFPKEGCHRSGMHTPSWAACNTRGDKWGEIRGATSPLPSRGSPQWRKIEVVPTKHTMHYS